MDVEFMNGYQEFCKETNEVATAIDEDRKDVYTAMTNNLKGIFKENGLDVRDITITDDGSVISVRFLGNTSKSINFSKKLVDELDMGFSVKHGYNHLAESEMFVQLYPLGDD